MRCVWVRTVNKQTWGPSKPRVARELDLEKTTELRYIMNFYLFLFFKFLLKKLNGETVHGILVHHFYSSLLSGSLVIVVYDSNLFSVITNLSHFM